LRNKINTNIYFADQIDSGNSNHSTQKLSLTQTLYAYFEPLNIKLEGKTKSHKERFITYLPIGFLHDQLLRLCISVSSINIDTEITSDEQFVKMIFEGDATKEDISEIANKIIPQIDDLSIDKLNWSAGYLGIIQIILISYISSRMQDKKEIKDLNLSII